MRNSEEVASLFAPGEVHVWGKRLDLKAPWEITDILELDVTEATRAMRFTHMESRMRFLRAHRYLRTVLGAYLGVYPRAVRLVTDRRGKPALASTPGRRKPLHFNLSHSADQVVVALSADAAVGVDVELMERASDIERLAARYFAPKEYSAFLDAKARDEHIRFFYSIWVRKEAALKALGLGIRVPLTSVDVVTGAPDTPITVQLKPGEKPKGQVHIAELTEVSGCARAVARTSPITSVRHFSDPARELE